MPNYSWYNRPETVRGYKENPMPVSLEDLQIAAGIINKVGFSIDTNANISVSQDGGFSFDVVFRVGDHTENKSVTASPPYDWEDFERRLVEIAKEVRQAQPAES